MSVQLIQPWQSQVPEAITGVSNALVQAAQRRQQEEQDAADQLMKHRHMMNEERRAQAQEERQARMDEQQATRERAGAIEEIRGHLKNNDYESAQLAASKYGFSLPQLHPQEQPPAQPPQGPMQLGQSPIPGPQQPGMAPPHQDPGLAGPGAPAQPGGQTTVPNPEDAAHMDFAHGLLTSDQRHARDADRSRQFVQARDAVKSGAVPPQAPAYSLLDRGGGQLAQFDTAKFAQQREDEKAQLMAKLQQSYGHDPEALRRATAMATLGQSPDNIVKALNAIDTERAKFEGKKTLEQMQEDAGKYKRHGRVAGDGTGGGGTAFNPKVETANARSLKMLDTETNRWARQSGYEQLHKSRVELEHVREQIASGNPMAAAAALEKLTSVARGGAASQGALALMQKHLSGTVGGIEGFIAGAGSGKYGAEQLRNLKGAADVMQQALDKDIAAKHEEFVKGHYTPGHYLQKGNVEDIEENLFGDVGYHPRYDPQAPTITPGSGLAPTKTRSGRGEAAPNPLVAAAKQGKLPQADQALAAKAKATKPNDPLYPSAQKWLQAHGLQ